jgi:hypothetical protein
MTEHPSEDPAEHAEDFSRVYVEDPEIVAGQAMMDLGIPDDQMGEIIAHEPAEHEYGGDHELTLITGPERKLPMSHSARELLKKMKSGWRGR